MEGFRDHRLVATLRELAARRTAVGLISLPESERVRQLSQIAVENRVFYDLVVQELKRRETGYDNQENKCE